MDLPAYTRGLLTRIQTRQIFITKKENQRSNLCCHGRRRMSVLVNGNRGVDTGYQAFEANNNAKKQRLTFEVALGEIHLI